MFLVILTTVIFLLLIFFYTRTEYFAPYASILIPITVNSSAGFDDPDQYGEILDPYWKEKNASADQLFKETHALYI